MLVETFITFAVSDGVYGLPALEVQEVIRMVSLVSVPFRPGGLAGLLNLRGELIPVLDLRWPFGDPPVPHHPGQHLLVVKGPARPLALLADRALEMINTEPGEIALGQIDGSSSGIIGVIQRAEVCVSVLDVRFLCQQMEIVLRQLEKLVAST